MYSVRNRQEACPNGLAYSELDNWKAQFRTKAERQAHLDRCGGIDRRGPTCENIRTTPELVDDPLPYREAKSAKSFGFNLDGTDNGRETATTCAHDKFVSVDGKRTDIDNQFYRLFGCQPIAHSQLSQSEQTRGTFSIAQNRKYRTLLEIRGVDDERDDSEVEVVIYQGRSPLLVNSENKAIAWQSQLIDKNVPAQYLRGRLVEGELITEPADSIWEDVTFMPFEPSVLIRGAQLRLKLGEAGAEGMRVGYVDADSWFRARQTWATLSQPFNDSIPSFYEALHRLADGYKDPATGRCTALSSAMKLDFVRAYILDP